MTFDEMVAAWRADPEGMRAAGQEAGALPADEHIAEFRDDGWGLQHPLRCRPDLIGCAVNRAVSTLCDESDEPPRPVGRYVVTLDDDSEPVFRFVSPEDQQ